MKAELFYSTHGGYKQQQHLYNFFIKKKGVPIEILKESVEEYKSTLKPAWQKNPEKVMRLCVLNFGQLLDIVKSKTDIAFGPLKEKRHADYDRWWQEKNLDGSFAYNGVTEDF